jgi:tetratricopeptide (TPR) repeat protein
MNAVVLVAVLGLAGPASAQGGPRVDFDLAPVAEAVSTADRLQAEAYTLFEDRQKWGRAARLLERSAQLREDHDPARARGYLMAARVYSQSQELGAAQRAFEKSAASAERIGAVVDAALAYVDAADMSLRRGDAETAHAHIRRATLLSASPHLDEGERGTITKRLPL